MARLFTLSIMALIWAEPVLAQSAGRPGNGQGGGPRNVPEIDLFSGAAALMVLATLGLLLWERHRRALR